MCVTGRECLLPVILLCVSPLRRNFDGFVFKEKGAAGG